MTTTRVPPRAAAVIALCVALVFVGSAGTAFWLTTRAPDVSVTSPADYPALLLKAADDTAARLAPDGPGLSFTTQQRQMFQHREGAPPLLEPNPSPSGSPVAVDFINAAYNLTRGFVHGSDFVLDIRGVSPSSDNPDFETADKIFFIIAHEGHIWRQEGQGFFESDWSPGLGVDPFSLSRLPILLRRLDRVEDKGDETFQNQPSRHFIGLAASADWPGFTSSDGVNFTSSPIPVSVWVAPDGRLLGISGQARNLNESVQNLEIIDGIAFGVDVPAILPSPFPTRDPQPTRRPQPTLPPLAPTPTTTTPEATPAPSADPTPNPSPSTGVTP